METRRIRGTESEGFKRLHIAADIMIKLGETFRERAGMVKWGRRDLALASALINKLFARMLETVPLDQLVTMHHNVEHAVYTVGVKRAGVTENDKDFGMWVSWATIKELTDAAGEKCKLCDLDPQQQRQCPLAKALDTLPAVKDERGNGCGWFGKV